VRNRPAGVNDRVAFPLNSFMPSISKRGNRYLRVLFVQAAWVVLSRPLKIRFVEPNCEGLE
jgi:hypothetical protein